MAPKKPRKNMPRCTDRQVGKQGTQQSIADARIPIDLQQTVLNVFSSAFPLAEGNCLSSTIQQVKGHLYNRDFASAFGRQEYLDAYALRWSASRALAYADIFVGLGIKDRWAQIQPSNSCASKAVCIGGGAGAEVIGLAAVVSLCSIPSMHITAVDVADWTQCLQGLEHALSTPPPLPTYASNSAKAAHRSLTDAGQVSVQLVRQDVLDYQEEDLRTLLAGASLVTIMFTLNELFTSSIPRTTAFLLALTDAMDPDSRLLVVDSPGSYSEVKLGMDAEPKRYPMKWLLDHTLLQVAGHEPNGCPKWMKVVDEESRWFRINTALRYPIELESMRFQMHYYHRQGPDNFASGLNSEEASTS